ncbi:MAG: acetylglutamate kinase [Alphaproteobacteria bacterium]|nr:acetylglutamate kinase [Alphaproteobacteria bacterium]
MTTDTSEFYRQRYKDSLFVVKAGGRIIEDGNALSSLLGNIRDLLTADIKVLLVYGGGKAMDAALLEAGIQSRRENGIRLTAAPDMRIIQKVMAGDLGYRIATEMERRSLSGLTLSAIPPGWVNLSFPKRAPEFQNFDAEITGIDNEAVKRVLSAAGFLACPCLATAGGHGVNINADNVAVALASGLPSRKLIFLSDVDGVLVNGETAPVLTDSDIHSLIADGTITGGMKVKMENCLHALQSGVRRIHLLNGFRENALLHEIYEPTGPGTLILREEDRERYARELEMDEA